MHKSVSVTIFRVAAELGLGVGSLNRSEKPAYRSESGLNGSGLLPTNYKPGKGTNQPAQRPSPDKRRGEKHIKYKDLTVQ